MITPREGVVVAGRYTLQRLLARGGMGSLWVARHEDLEIEVSVKFMAPSLVASGEARARFEREAKSAARLGSQHVVQILDYGVEDETPFIVMELLRGESLWTRLSRDGRLPLPDAARLVVQVCKALRTAHEAGLVHRDLKPSNVFLARKDEEEVAKVLDFGIAKLTQHGQVPSGTATGVLLGSVHYMSPEQVRDSRRVDHRSDLWSFGVILYRALTGTLPFPGGEAGDVLVRVCTEPIPPPSSVVRDLPETADAFFARALSRDPAQRFQSARELAEAFSAMALAKGPPSSRRALESEPDLLPSLDRTAPLDPLIKAGVLAAPSPMLAKPAPPAEPDLLGGGTMPLFPPDFRAAVAAADEVEAATRVFRAPFLSQGPVAEAAPVSRAGPVSQQAPSSQTPPGAYPAPAIPAAPGVWSAPPAPAWQGAWQAPGPPSADPPTGPPITGSTRPVAGELPRGRGLRGPWPALALAALVVTAGAALLIRLFVFHGGGAPAVGRGAPSATAAASAFPAPTAVGSSPPAALSAPASGPAPIEPAANGEPSSTARSPAPGAPATSASGARSTAAPGRLDGRSTIIRGDLFPDPPPRGAPTSPPATAPEKPRGRIF